MSWLGDFFSNPLKQGFEALGQLPGTPEAATQALAGGLSGDLSWNPYGQENSVYDYTALGGNRSQNPQDRQLGRTIGTAVGNYFTAGALSPYLGAAGGAAASGGLWSGAQAAGQGGDSGQIGDAFLRNAALSGLSSYAPNYAGGMGVTDPTYASAINGGISGGAIAGLQGKDIGQGAAGGAITGGLAGLGAPNPGTSTEYGQSVAPWAKEGAFQPGGEYGPQSSPAPWAQGPSPSFSPLNNASVENSPGMEQDNPLMSGVKKLLGSLGGESGPGKVGNLSYGDMAQGLMGMYGGYKQRKQAKDMMGMVGGRRGAYEQQLRGNLRAKDAAAGKRSNYAGRETQLQASLAELDARNAPMMNQLSNQSFGGLANMLQSGAGMAARGGLFGPEFMRGYRAPAPQPQATPYLGSLIGQPQAPADYSLDYNRRNPFGGG